MVRKMLINASHSEECRVAVVSDGILEELDIQINAREATLGNIYKGVITRVEPSLQAAFVDYGARRNGFLSINDVHPSYFPESFETGGRRPRIQDVFKKDDHVIVQVNKEERETKGASLTTNISLAGRFLVLMPGTDLCGVSRKIEDEKERKKLKEILKQLSPPENMGFIIRTAGMGRTKTELSRDLNYVLKLWRAIEKNVGNENAPALLYREHDVVIRSIRDHFSPDISEILVDEKEVFKKAKDFFRQVMPKHENLVRLSQERRPLFNKYQLEDQIEQVYRKRIKLKSGGYIIIEPTEALVTVDVNSGSAIREKGIEETAYRVNMEAAPEVARQLRLRDLGGIIVIDFIDMVQKKHKQEVEKTVRAELKKDRAKTKVLRISALGLLELSRQRLKSSLGTGEYQECPLCEGLGKVKSPEMTALSVFRKMKSQLLKDGVSEVKAVVPPRVADYLLNRMRAHLVELERDYTARITVVADHGVTDREILIETSKEEPAEPPVIVEALPEEEPVMASPTTSAQEVEALEEPALTPDAEKRHTKRSARRRRRTKRRIPLEPGAEIVVAGTNQETDVVEAQEQASAVEPSYQDIVYQDVGIELVPQSAASETDEEQPAEPLGGDEADSPDDLTAEADADSSEEARVLEAPVAPDPDSPDTEMEEPKKREHRPRKVSLQSYLPFS
jgi:ribonuclease E